MSLPTTKILPPVPDFETLEEAKKYLHDLTFELQNMYQNTTQNINGFIRNSDDVDGSEWIPTITSTGVIGTITYGPQKGWVLRTGLLTEVWFNITWSSSGGSTGDLRLELPYKVTKGMSSTGNVFVGPAITSDSLTYPVGTTAPVIIAIFDSFVAGMAAGGSGVASGNIQIAASGGIEGSLRYIGVEDE